MDKLETNLGPNLNTIQFSCIYKFYVYMNFFSHQTIVINKNPVDKLQTSSGLNLDMIQFSYICKFYIHMNFFSH